MKQGGGDGEFENQQDENGHDGGQKGLVRIRDRSRCDLGKQDGDDEFGSLELADLPLAHQPDHEKQQEIQKYGAKNDRQHRQMIAMIFGYYSCGTGKETKPPKNFEKRVDKREKKC